MGGETRSRHGKGRWLGAVARSLLVTAGIAGGSALLWQVSPRGASLFLLISSMALLLCSYRRPWPVRWFSVLAPLCGTVCAFGLQWAFLRTAPVDLTVGVGVAVGVVLGGLKGVGHKVERAGGRVVARRTLLVLGVVLVSFLLTHSAALFGTRKMVDWGLSGGVMVTALTVAFYLVMWYRYLLWKPSGAPVQTGLEAVRSLLMVAGFVGMAAALVAPAVAQQHVRGTESALGTTRGVPPVTEQGLRYGKTEYDGLMNPAALRQLGALKGRWVLSNKMLKWYTNLEGWKFSGCKLTVDWDQMTATMTPGQLTFVFLTGKEKSGRVQPTGRKTIVETIRPLLPYVVTQGLGDQVTMTGAYSYRKVEETVSFLTNGRQQKSKPYTFDAGNRCHIISNVTNQASASRLRHSFLPGTQAHGKTEQHSSGSSTTWMNLPPGVLRMGMSFAEFKQAGCKLSVWETDGFFKSVRTVGRPPATPRLHEEERPSRDPWIRYNHAGTTVLEGKLVGARPADGDRRMAERCLQDFQMRARAKLLSGHGPRTFQNPQAPAYKSTRFRKLAWAASALEMAIDWDKRTASLKPFTIDTSAKVLASEAVRGRVSVGQPLTLIRRRITFQQLKPGRVTYHPGGIRDITGGTVAIGIVARTYGIQMRRDGDGQPVEVTTLNRTDSVPIVRSRGKPVPVRWQAIPQANGTLLVRLYMHPCACTATGSKELIPARYDFALARRSGAPIVPPPGPPVAHAQRPPRDERPPDEPTRDRPEPYDPGDPEIDDPEDPGPDDAGVADRTGTEGTAADGTGEPAGGDEGGGTLAGPTPAAASVVAAPGDEDTSPPYVDPSVVSGDWLDDYIPPGPLSAAAVSAGAMAGLFMLGLGAAAHAAMSASAAGQGAAGDMGLDFFEPAEQPPLIDPYTGKPLDTDGDHVWWPWGDTDAGWVDRATAEQYVREGLQERHDRDLEVSESVAQWNRDRDAEYAQREQDLVDEGNVWNAELQAYVPAGYTYDHERGALVPPGHAWDEDREAYLPETVWDRNTDNEANRAYLYWDTIDENWDHLTGDQQAIVRNQLNELGLRDTADLSLSDLEDLSPEQLDRFCDLAYAVNDIRAGQVEGIEAAHDLADAWMIRREEAAGTVKGAAVGLGVSLAVTATLGAGAVVPVSAGMGFVFGPTTPEGGIGQRVKNGVISGVGAYAGMKFGQFVRPSNVLALSTVQTVGSAGISAAEMAAMGGSADDIKKAALLGGFLGGTSATLRTPTIQRFLHGGPPIVRGPVATAYANWQSAHVPPRPGTPVIHGSMQHAFANNDHVPSRPAGPATAASAGSLADSSLPTIRNSTDRAFVNWDRASGLPRPPGSEPPGPVAGGLAGDELPSIRRSTDSAFANHDPVPPRAPGSAPPPGGAADDGLPTIRGTTDEAYANWEGPATRSSQHAPAPDAPDGVAPPRAGQRGGPGAGLGDDGQPVYDLGEAPSPAAAQRQQQDILRQLGTDPDAGARTPDGGALPGALEHGAGGYSGEEGARAFTEERFVIGKDNQVRPAPGIGQQDVGLGDDVRVTRDRFTGEITDYERGPGVSDRRFQQIKNGQIDLELPPVQDRPGVRPGYDHANVVHDAAEGGAPGAIDRALQGTPVEGEHAWRPPADDGATLPASAPDGAAIDPARTQFHAEAHVRVEAVGPDGPRFDQGDLLDYARNRYPNLPSRNAVAQAEADLTQRFNQHREAAASGGHVPPWDRSRSAPLPIPDDAELGQRFVTDLGIDSPGQVGRAEQAAEVLRRGEQPDLPDRTIPSEDAWDFKKSNVDRAVREGVSGGDTDAEAALRPPADLEIEGRRPGWVEQYIDQREEFPWLDKTDSAVRETWRETGAGADPESVQRFHDSLQQKVEAGQLDKKHVAGWFEMQRGFQASRGQVRLPDSVRPPEVDQTIQTLKTDDLSLGSRMDRFDSELRQQWGERHIDEVPSLDPRHAERRREFFSHMEQRASEDPKFAKDFDDWVKHVVKKEPYTYIPYDRDAQPPTG